MNTIKVATVVFYDGVRAYTTHRALYVTENDVRYVKEKFFEYFIIND